MSEDYPDCLEVRCPRCDTLATKASEGSVIEHKCRKCGVYFSGVVTEDEFVPDRKNRPDGQTRTRPIIPTEGPRFKNTL